jgi:ferric-dicitrate binding protein FerR (iron transport regulator)
MNDNERIFEIASLIRKKLLDVITDTEQKTLDSWLNESHTNRDLYRRIVQKAEIDSKHDYYEYIDTESALKSVLSGIGIPDRQRSIPWKSLLRYAAIFILPLLAGAYMFTRLFTGLSFYQAGESTQIPPGSPKAILTLSSGERIVLDQESQNLVTAERNVVLRDSAMCLRYTEDAASIPPDPSVYIAAHIIEIPRGGEYVLQLSDGTRIWLNAESKLSYPSAFSGEVREVELEGEAFLEVAENPDRPFVVRTGDLEIEVLGTSFNIMSYPDEYSIETTLDEGKVMLRIPESGSEACSLLPGEQAVYDRNTGAITIREVDPDNYSAWRVGTYIIDKQSLEVLMHRLGRWYNFETKFTSPTIREYRFSGTLDRKDDLSRILELIQKTSDLQMEIVSAGQVVIRKDQE